MPRPGPSSPPALYCLRGNVEDRKRTWLLPVGESTLGSSEANDLVLPVPGVSRQHAALAADAQGVEVSDLASTNGSFVNGLRIERARARPGDALRFGPVSLTLEEVDPGDTRLAIEIRPAAAPAGLPADKSTERMEGPPPGFAPGGSAGIERFLDRLAASRERGAPAVLDALAAELHAPDVGLVEWSPRKEPLLVAHRGSVEDPAEHLPLRALVEAVAQDSGASTVCRSGAIEEPESARFAFAVLGRPRTVPLALLLWGGPTGDGTEELLRVALRLLAGLPGWGPAPVPPQGRPDLVDLPVLRFPPGIVPGASPAMERLYGEVRALCRGDLPVLVTGETGVGKEHVARLLHLSSAWARGPFVAMNCAAIPGDLLEAEMFGVAEGAATGVLAREGHFAQARGGTLFLDELGDLPLPLQGKLLRALQEKEIQPVGGRPAAIDVRIVAATNRDLLAEAEAGRFRTDLYYRIAGAVLVVPPLRVRQEDIPALVESFLHAAAQAADKGVRGLTVKALGALSAYPWPGNVRELEHEVHRLVQACPAGQAIDSTTLPERFAVPAAERPAPEPSGSLRLDRHVLALERRLIRQALEESGGSQRKAAAALGISRNALTRKMRKLEI